MQARMGAHGRSGQSYRRPLCEDALHPIGVVAYPLRRRKLSIAGLMTSG